MPPYSRSAWRCASNWVSVPRRALRGHAPVGGTCGWRFRALRFSAPKGVERACPSSKVVRTRWSCSKGFSAPKGVERACPNGPCPARPAPLDLVSVPRRALRGHAPAPQAWGEFLADGFSAPKGVERACPTAMLFITWKETRFQCPEGR